MLQSGIMALEEPHCGQGASPDGRGAFPSEAPILLPGTLSGLLTYPTLTLSQHTPVPGQVCPLLFLHS